jgi:hypothetical protein
MSSATDSRSYALDPSAFAEALVAAGQANRLLLKSRTDGAVTLGRTLQAAQLLVAGEDHRHTQAVGPATSASGPYRRATVGMYSRRSRPPWQTARRRRSARILVNA